MLTINNKKREPVLFNWVDGDQDEIQLLITQMTVSDRVKLSKLHGETTEDESLSAEERGAMFLTARVMCSIKTQDGDHFFTGSVKETHEQIDGDALYQLSAEIGILNPVGEVKLVDAKK